MAASDKHAATNTAGTIVYIGAGHCSDLPELLAANPTRLVLIEPQPRFAQALRWETEGHENVEVIEAAVSPEDPPMRLKVFSLPGLSSLREPVALREVFPGLKFIEEIDVEVIAPADLVGGEKLDLDQGNCLILDAPGEGAAILRALLETGKLTVFERVDLYCGPMVYLENCSTGGELVERLEAEGYEVERDEVAVVDSGRTLWRLRHNRLKLENHALQAQLNDAESQIEQLKTDLAEKDRRLEISNEEIAKSEAQVDLIKEILVSER